MAKPQLEDGFTSIANEILENLARASLTPNQWQVLLVIIRKTYGYRKKVDYIANSQIVEATGLCKAVVSRCLKNLSDMQVITREGKSVGIQKDWEKWEKLAVLLTIAPKEPPLMRIVRADGYIGIWKGAVEPEFQSMASKQGYILEHRLVMARSLGRCLEPWEVVHHKDRVRSHNNEDNLELLPSKTEHMPSILAQQRIKQLEAELARLLTKVDDKKLAVQSPTVAIQSTKVSSPAVAQKKKETIQKKDVLHKKYGEFENVLLTDAEKQKLEDRFNKQTAVLIERLSTYMKSSGRPYKSHYATILSWVLRDEKEAKSGKAKHSRDLPQTYTEPDDYPDD